MGGRALKKKRGRNLSSMSSRFIPLCITTALFLLLSSSGVPPLCMWPQLPSLLEIPAAHAQILTAPPGSVKKIVIPPEGAEPGWELEGQEKHMLGAPKVGRKADLRVDMKVVTLITLPKLY